MRNEVYELKNKWRTCNGKLGVLLIRSKENDGKKVTSKDVISL